MQGPKLALKQLPNAADITSQVEPHVIFRRYGAHNGFVALFRQNIPETKGKSLEEIEQHWNSFS